MTSGTGTSARSEAPPGKWSSGVRARLLVLVAAATIPVLGIAGANAWNEYENALARASREAQVFVESAAGRQAASFDNMQELVESLARRPDLLGRDASACDAALGEIHALFAQRYTNIWILNPAGYTVCSALPAPRDIAYTNLDYYRAVLAEDHFVLGGFMTGIISGRPVITGAAPMRDASGTLVGIVGAALRLDILSNETRAFPASDEHGLWLLDRAGQVLALNQAQDSELPPPDILVAASLTGSATFSGLGRDGRGYAWSITALEPNIRVLGSVATAEVEREARDRLVSRAIELGLFLTACILAVVAGVELTVAWPLRRLASAVTGWAPGQAFTAPDTAFRPREVARLSDALSAASAAIAERESALRAALEQRDLLMADIHHRVKNNLQIVASLLNLQADRAREPGASAEFAMARERVQALATLHQHLYMRRNYEQADLRPFLDDLCRQLSETLGADRRNKVSIDIKVADIALPSDQAISMALLMTEAVSNAMRHGFADGRRGNIRVSLRQEGEKAILEIADDGVGMAEESGSEGLGLFLIRGFAAHLGGELEIDTSQGTRIIVEFPIPQDQDEQRLEAA